MHITSTGLENKEEGNVCNSSNSNLSDFQDGKGNVCNSSLDHIGPWNVHVCAQVSREFEKDCRFLECPCLQEQKGLSQLRQIVSHLHFVSTKNKGSAGTMELQNIRSALDSPASSRFSFGFSGRYSLAGTTESQNRRSTLDFSASSSRFSCGSI